MRVGKKLIAFEDKINTYFLKCELDGTYPDEAGLILHLGLAKEDYAKYRDNADGNYAGFARCLESARLRRESIIVRDIYSSDSKSPSGKIFLARQSGNGGLSDKLPNDAKKVTIEVSLGGGAAEQFE